ncbi:MAG: hypothetical protein ACUVXI_01375 [bacterium]
MDEGGLIRRLEICKGELARLEGAYNALQNQIRPLKLRIEEKRREFIQLYMRVYYENLPQSFGREFIPSDGGFSFGEGDHLRRLRGGG